MYNQVSFEEYHLSFMTKNKFTKEALFSELAEQLNELAEYIESALGDDFCFQLLGISREIIQSDFFERNRFTTESIQSLPVTDSYSRIYDYVFDAYWGGGDISEPLEDLALFMELCGQWMDEKASKCRYLHDAGFARWYIDEPEYQHDLILRQVALLANVDERTVRNAASLKAENQLITHKDGGRTFISPKNALTWLSTRPGFKATEFASAKNILPTLSFFSIVELGQKLKERRLEMSLSCEELAGKLGWSNEKADYIEQIEKGNVQPELGDMLPLAKVLMLDEYKFLNSFMKVFYSDELRLLQ